MGRAIFDDITPPHEKGDDTATAQGEHSIRDVTPLATRERETRRAKRAERRKVPNTFTEFGKTSTMRSVKSPIGKVGVWAVAVAFLVVALSAVGFIFIGKTTISIEPQQEDIILASNLVSTAYRNAENGELGYKVLASSIEATKTIAATGKENVQQKASGRIVVYNNHSSATQRLIKNTRFETPSGEIYRVRNSLVVPGKKEDGTPGAIEVTVYADKPGEDQNFTNLGAKFTIPGLKGDPRFDTFYAELKTPITGGFSGERAIVDEDVLNAARTNLRAQLKDGVNAAIRSKAPDSVELFDGGIFTTFESREVKYSDDGTAVVREVAQIYAVTFDKNKLARTLAKIAIATPPDGNILINSPDNLTMNIVNKAGVDINNDALIQFTLEGKTSLIWQIDAESLKQDLVGKNSDALNTIMGAYPGIKSAQATIRPFWKSDFPSDTGGITVEILTKK